MVKDFDEMSKEIVEKIGGQENVNKIMHCMTRLRIIVNDDSKVLLKQLKQVEGVISVVTAGGQYQVVIGRNVNKVYDAVICNFDMSNKIGNSIGDVNESIESEIMRKSGKKKLTEVLIDTISGIFLPVLPALTAVGVLKGILIGLTSLGVMSTKNDTYILLYALAQAFFHFIPLALAISAADKFKVNRFIALAVVCAMIYPDIIPGMGKSVVYKLFDIIPIKMIDYTSTIIPPIVVVWMTSKIYRLFKRIVPEILDMVLTPLLTIVIAFPIALFVVGPVTNYVGSGMAYAFQAAMNAAPILASAILGLFWPITVVFGLHWGFMPIVIQNLSTLGYDTFAPITVASNFTTMGACVAVFLKTKNKKLKEISGGAAFSAIIGGITEPGVYGVTLKYKKPFILCCVFTCIGGIIVSLGNAKYPGVMTVSTVTLPSLAILPGGAYVLAASIVGFLGTAITTFLFGFKDSMIMENENKGEVK